MAKTKKRSSFAELAEEFIKNTDPGEARRAARESLRRMRRKAAYEGLKRDCKKAQKD